MNTAIDSNWISSKGAFLDKFQIEFAKKIGVKYALAVSNGTVALHLAMLALGVTTGDEVIVPTLTYVAPVNAIRYVGATPVFAEAAKSGWQIDPSKIERLITRNTRAIVAVHLYGQTCDLAPLREIADRHEIFLIEDCSESFGAKYRNRHAGTFGDISTFSFYGNKTITTGEGGMVVTNDKTLIERAARIRGQGLAAYREYWHDIVGYNFRMSNLAAAIGVAQLERSDEILSKKRKLGEKYRQLLQYLPIEFHDPMDGFDHTHWMVSVLVKDSATRTALRSYLQNCGIETRPVFHPVHTMPMYSESFRRFPIAEDISWRGINLPSFHHISDSELGEVCDQIKAFYK